MRSWRPLLFAFLIVVGCSDDTQEPVLQLADQRDGQPGWQWSNPRPQGNDLNDVDFFDQRIGFAAGVFGAIVRTVDGGINWELQKSGTTERLFGVAANGEKGAVAVGANGTILRTINRGATWERRQSGVTAGLNDVDFADANHGIIVGEDAILRTSDAGSTWTPVDLIVLPHDAEGHVRFSRVCMVDANTAFALGTYGLLYATFDGGATWVERPTPRGNLRSVSFTDPNVGTVVGLDGVVLRTHDGGLNWILIDAHTSRTLSGVAFVDADHGIIVSSDSTPFGSHLLYTSDGGETWSGPDGPPAPGVLSDFRNVAMLDGNTGVVVGSQGNIFRTADAGQSWEDQAHFPALRLPGISFVNASDGIAVGPAIILRTQDGGATWTRSNPGPLFLNDVSYVGPTRVVVVGSDAITRSGTILRSTDGGANWTTISVDPIFPWAVDFGDGLNGSTVGNGGVILHTTDAGVTWSPQESGTTATLYDVSMSNANTAIAVGAHGTLLRTTDGGTHWQNLPQSAVTTDLMGVDFADSEVGFVVGGENTILRTTDGGATWASQDSGINGWFVDVACVDRKSAVVLAVIRGALPRVLTTTDGGDHWMESDPIAAYLGPMALCMAGKKTVTVAGELGMILQNHHIFP